MDDDDEALHAALRQRISELRTEHDDLDDAIDRWLAADDYIEIRVLPR